MEYTVRSKSPAVRAFVESTCRFLAQELKIAKSAWNLEIQMVKNLRTREGMRGSMVNLGGKYILMEIDSTLSFEALIDTIAHEMVHVKQTVKGQYRVEMKGRTVHRYWRGKKVQADYYDQPWEKEAWSREKLLASRLHALFDKLNKQP